jgi:hypothetical protein
MREACAKRHHTRPGGVAPAAFAPPAHRRKKAPATKATGLCTPSPKWNNRDGVRARPLLPLPGPLPDLPCAGRQKPARVVAGSGLGVVGAAGPPRGRRKRKGHQARERRPGSPKPQGEGANCGGNDRTPSRSCLVQKRKNFVSRGADHFAALRGPSRPEPQRTKL